MRCLNELSFFKMMLSYFPVHKIKCWWDQKGRACLRNMWLKQLYIRKKLRQRGLSDLPNITEPLS